MAEVKMRVVHSGQYEPGGDHYRVYELETDMNKKEVEAWCKREILSSRPIPSEAEFKARENSDEYEMSYEEYLRGYWYLQQTDDGTWRFTRVTMYTD